MSAKTKSLPSQNIICLKNKLSWRPEAVSLIQMESDWKPFLKEFGVPGQYFTFDLISIGYEGRSFFWAENQIYGFLLPVWQLAMSSGTTLKTVKCFYHCTDSHLSLFSQVSQFFLNAKVTSDTNSLTPPQHQGLKLTTRPFSSREPITDRSAISCFVLYQYYYSCFEPRLLGKMNDQ